MNALLKFFTGSSMKAHLKSVIESKYNSHFLSHTIKSFFIAFVRMNKILLNVTVNIFGQRKIPFLQNYIFMYEHFTIKYRFEFFETFVWNKLLLR